MKNLDRMVMVGLVAALITFVVSTGYWDIFDLLISLLAFILIEEYMKANKNSITQHFLFSLFCYSTIATILVVSYLAVLGTTLNYELITIVPIENIKEIYQLKDQKPNSDDLLQDQFIHQNVIFICSLLFSGVRLALLKENKVTSQLE